MHNLQTIKTPKRLKIAKVYLRHKTIISQNMLSEGQIKILSVSKKSYVPLSRYSSFCIYHDLS